MLCKNPYMGAGRIPFGCGQCLHCRINRRRAWTWRQVLESYGHAQSSFVTLTYRPDDEPAGGNLCKRDAQLFLKRLRKRFEKLNSGGIKDPVRVRYFLVGEYGPETTRPHYHASIFGLPANLNALVAECWGKGFVQVAEFNHLTAQYTAGYVVKKLTDKTDPRLNGLSPEFALMSRRPGIGALAMDIIAKSLKESTGALESIRRGLDVPSSLKIGGRTIPLGPFLKRRLRDAFGMTGDDRKIASFDYSVAEQAEMQRLLKIAGDGASAKEVFLEAIAQDLLNAEAKAKLWKKVGRL